MRFAIVTALILAGCSTLDLSQPIELVPEKGWQPWEVQLLASAADCWNRRFGTELDVTESPTLPQQVTVAYNDFVCIYARGVTQPNRPVRVHLCPPRYASTYESVQERILFVLALHELGHVVNIRYHSDDPDAVMAGGEDEADGIYMAVPARFAVDDDRLFHDANPEFKPSPPPCNAVSIRGYPPYRCSCTP